MIPHILHQTAPQKPLSWEEERLSARARALLAGWEYRLWDDAANAWLVAEHFAAHAEAYGAIRRGVVKADIARCMYMAVFGGFYFDTDYRLDRVIPAEMMAASCLLPVSRGTVAEIGDPGFRLGNAVFASAPGHPFWRAFIDHVFAEARLADLAENRVEGTTGPDGLTRFYLAHRARFPDIELPARAYFHAPNSLAGRNPARIGVHLCWGSWRSKGPLRRTAVRLRRKLQAVL